MRVLVVTNTIYRGLNFILRNLTSALGQLNQQDGDVLLIDQNKAPVELPEKILTTPNFKRELYPIQTISQARNFLLNWKQTDQYDWIIFCDDDGYFCADYISKFKKIVNENPNLDAIAGGIMVHGTKNYYSPRHAIGGSLKNLFNYKLLMGANFAIRPKVFKELNGFDERFGAGAEWASGEESDLSLRLIFKNKNLEYFKDLIVFHEAPRAGAVELEQKKAYRGGLGKGALVYKWIFEMKKPILIFEFIEMLIIPSVWFVVNTLRFKKGSTIFLYTLVGRVRGFLGAATR